uniref:Novel immune-type receptor 8 isoform 1 n=1 Tax=Oryzias latipes TaxID=8090 RepID=B3TZA1_ORYLA|nr:novel immune-type receptor 8 [Oryzias latipes]ACB86918.1 novel immune-type receptor 8 isoform 1 [Oryzias latipes]
MILFYVVFIITNGYCANEYNFTTKTVPVGEDVKLTCARQTDVLYRENLFWIRIVSGKKPELLGGTMNFDFDVEIRKSHITAKQEPGSFVLEINEAMESDDGVYYCIKVQNLNLTFLTGTFLSVKGREPDIVAVTERFGSNKFYPEDPITLECSVLSSSDHETCAAEQRVFWFKTQSNKSHPHVIYAHGNSSDECLRTPEAPSVQKCVYSFNKNFISSDAGTYYCAVAACGEIFYGNGTTLTELQMWDLQTANTVLLVLFATFSASIFVIIFLLCKIKKKSGSSFNDVLNSSDDGKHQKSKDDSLTYSAATFTKRKAGRFATSQEAL